MNNILGRIFGKDKTPKMIEKMPNTEEWLCRLCSEYFHASKLEQHIKDNHMDDYKKSVW